MKFRNKKKAQMQQVFTYIMTGIVIVAVLGFGISQIMNIKNTADDIACLDFKQDLAQKVYASGSYGNIEKGDLFVDCNYRYIWFLNVDDCVNGDSEIQLGENVDPIIKNSCEGKVRYNVFMGNDVAEDFLYIEGLKVRGDSSSSSILKFDLSSGRRVYLKFQGTGSGMIVSKDVSA